MVEKLPKNVTIYSLEELKIQINIILIISDKIIDNLSKESVIYRPKFSYWSWITLGHNKRNYSRRIRFMTLKEIHFEFKINC